MSACSRASWESCASSLPRAPRSMRCSSSLRGLRAWDRPFSPASAGWREDSVHAPLNVGQERSCPTFSFLKLVCCTHGTQDLRHEIDDVRKGELKGNVQKPRDEEDEEVGDERYHESDDRIADHVDRLLDLVFASGGEDEGDAPDDDE